MKNRTLFIIRMCVALLLNTLVGMIIASLIGFPIWAGAVAVNAIAILLGPIAPRFATRAGLYQEFWTGETIKAFRNSLESLGWINKIRSYDAQVANNNTIHFVDLGGDPTVLVNNTSYPLGVESLEDADKAIALDKYQTKATRVTDDEARGLSYDKCGSVIERHRDSVDQERYARAIHALAPSQDTAKTPVITANGKLKVADIIALKKRFDKLRIPTQGRVLVLCPDHVSDLLEQDTTFAQRYNNHTTGAISNQYSFDIYEFVDAPNYKLDGSVYKKVPFGSIAGENEVFCNASVAFYAPRMMRAGGDVKAYIDEPDTQNQEWRYNVRLYFICLPMKNEAIGAIVTAPAAEETPAADTTTTETPASETPATETPAAETTPVTFQVFPNYNADDPNPVQLNITNHTSETVAVIPSNGAALSFDVEFNTPEGYDSAVDGEIVEWMGLSGDGHLVTFLVPEAMQSLASSDGVYPVTVTIGVAGSDATVTIPVTLTIE